MQPITVAIADANAERRTKLELALQKQHHVKILTNLPGSGSGSTRNRRRAPRCNQTVVDDLIARTRRLQPRVLLVNLYHCIEQNGELLNNLRQACPETRVILLTDNPEQQEKEVLQALSQGAKGFVNYDTTPDMISKAAKVIDGGGAWLPRKMLGKIMSRISPWHNRIEANLP